LKEIEKLKKDMGPIEQFLKEQGTNPLIEEQNMI